MTTVSRVMYGLACLLAVAAVLGGLGEAQQPQRPPIETTKVGGTDNVYIFRNVNHQSMFVVTSAGVIATDPVAYGKPTGGQAYASAEVKVAAREGKCWDTVEKELKIPKLESWPNYEAALPFLLRRYCGLWGRGT